MLTSVFHPTSVILIAIQAGHYVKTGVRNTRISVKKKTDAGTCVRSSFGTRLSPKRLQQRGKRKLRHPFPRANRQWNRISEMEDSNFSIKLEQMKSKIFIKCWVLHSFFACSLFPLRVKICINRWDIVYKIKINFLCSFSIDFN